MEFNFRAHSADTLTPVYKFDGDEIVDSQMYERCMMGGYMSTVSYGMGAAKAMSLDIDLETLERWKRICNAAYLIDDFVDTAPDTLTACEMYESSMDQIFQMTNEQILDKANLPANADDRLTPAIVLMKNSVSMLPDEQLAWLKKAALSINTITRYKLDCNDLTAYVSLLKREAYYTAALISGSASEGVRRQSSFPDFALWCQQLMEMAILADSAIDLKDDSEQRIMKINPTIRNMTKLALQAYCAGRVIVHEKPQRRATIASLIERSKFYRPKLR